MSILTDGFSTTLDFAAAAGLSLTLIEKTVTPPAMNMGGPIPQTAMRNVAFRTQVAKSLVTFEPLNFTAKYDPFMYTTAFAILGVNQVITINFPDTSTLVFYGWLESVAPGENSEGGEPIASCQVCISNLDPALAEVGPQYAA